MYTDDKTTVCSDQEHCDACPAEKDHVIEEFADPELDAAFASFDMSSLNGSMEDSFEAELVALQFRWSKLTVMVVSSTHLMSES
jgi:hypothetical protein